MSTPGAGALALVLAVAAASIAAAQDTVATRHRLTLDLTRLQPATRTYDIVVVAADSVRLIGERRIDVKPAVYAGSPAWVLVETRTGAVASTDSLFVSPDFRPLHWSSVVGQARLATEFVGDTLLGAATLGRWKENIALQGRPDLLVNGAMVDALLPMLPLTDAWADSAVALAMGVSSATVDDVQLAVVGTDSVPVDSGSASVWVIALRGPRSSVLYWVEKTTGVPVLIQQPLPAHVGGQLEYRLRAQPTGVSP